MAAPITVTPIIPLGRDTVIEGNPYQIPGRGNFYPRLPQPVMQQPVTPQPVMPQPVAMPTVSAGVNPYANMQSLLSSSRQNELAQGLLGLGFGLMQAGGPSATPVSFMGALGAGGQAGLKSYQDARTANLQNTLAAAKLRMDAQKAGQVVGSAETGFSYFNPVTRANQQLIAGAGRKPTSLYQDAVAAGLKPGTPEFQQFIRDARMKPSTTVDMTTDPMAAVRAKSYESAVNDAIARASSSAGMIPALQQAQALFDAGVPTGRISEMTMPIKQVINAITGSQYDETLTLQETMQSLGNALALRQHRPGMGPMTDADFVRYRAIAPNLANTPAGNRLIIQRLMYEAQGDQLYKREIMRQMQAGEPIDELAAWSSVQQQLGPLIPEVNTEMSMQDWANTDAARGYIGKVIMLNGKPQYVGA